MRLYLTRLKTETDFGERNKIVNIFILFYDILMRRVMVSNGGSIEKSKK